MTPVILFMLGGLLFMYYIGFYFGKKAKTNEIQNEAIEVGVGKFNSNGKFRWIHYYEV